VNEGGRDPEVGRRREQESYIPIERQISVFSAENYYVLKSCYIDPEIMSGGDGGGGGAAAAASVPSGGVCGGGFGDSPAGATSVLGSVGGSVEPSASALALAAAVAAAAAGRRRRRCWR
jgi:hypothetical protein